MSIIGSSRDKLVLGVAWACVISASALSLILWRNLGKSEPDWWPLLTASFLLVCTASAYISARLRSIRGYLTIISLAFLLGFGGGWDWGLIPLIRVSQLWVDFTSAQPLWISSIATHLLRLTPAAAIILYLLTKGRRLSDFYLKVGDVSAPAEPSRLIGMKRSESWVRIGLVFASVFFVGTLITLLGSGLSLSIVLSQVQVVPTALLLAALNAFNEEFTLRAAPLSELNSVGKSQALLLTSTYFGLGHYYGVPSGLLGVLLSGFLGWFLGKSILETRGFTWAWIIHFLPDTIIFTALVASAL